MKSKVGMNTVGFPAVTEMWTGIQVAAYIHKTQGCFRFQPQYCYNTIIIIYL